MAPQADDLRARQSDAGDPARRSARGAQRRDHRHRPHRLPEPDQQRPLLSRTSSAARSTRARRRSRSRWRSPRCTRSPSSRRPSRARSSRAAYAGATLSFGPEYLIPKPFDPRLMMKIAPAVAQGGGRVGRRAAADRRHGRLPREAADLRLRVGHDDAADLQPRQDGAEEAHRLRRGRGRARPARGAGRRRREPGAADADRPARGDRAAHREVRPAPAGRARLRPRQHRERPPLPRLLADLPRDDGAQGRDRAARQDRDAPPPDADRLDAAARPARSTACSAAPGAHRRCTCTTSTR